jgi:hypothetical protein
VARILNAVLAAVVGLALLVGGVLAALEIVLGMAGNGPTIVPYRRWHEHLMGHPWNGPWLRQAALLLIVAGLLVLALQLVRMRPRGVALETGRAGVEARVGRRTLEHSLARAAEDVDGITSASAQLTGKGRVRVVATSLGRESDAQRDLVVRAVKSRLASLRPVQPIEPAVTVRQETP